MTTRDSSSSLSRAFVAVELVLLILPITLISIALGGIMVYGVLYALGDGKLDLESSLLALSIVAAWGAIASAWFLGIAFVRRGRAGLLEAPWIFWALAVLGFLLVVGSLIFLMFDWNIPLWLGTPALVPFAHLLVERHLGETRG